MFTTSDSQFLPPICHVNENTPEEALHPEWVYTFYPTKDPAVDTDGGCEEWQMRVRCSEVPKGIPWGANVRPPNPNQSICRIIRKSLDENPMDFCFKNNGMKIACKKIWRDQDEEGLDCIKMLIPPSLGLFNGNHTYNVISAFFDQNSDNDSRVNVSVLVNPTPEQRQGAAVASNSGKNAKRKSIQNAKGYFDWIKEATKNHPCESVIGYPENAKMKDGHNPEVDVSFIKNMLWVTHVQKFPNGDTTTTLSGIFNQNNNIQDQYDAHLDDFKKYRTVLLDLFDIFDFVSESAAKVYHAEQAKKHAKRSCGLLEDSSRKAKTGETFPQLFSRKPITFELDKLWVLPIFAACRQFLRESGDHMEWKLPLVKIKELYTGVLPKMISACDVHRIQHRYPSTALTKNTEIWKNFYESLEIAYYKGQYYKYQT